MGIRLAADMTVKQTLDLYPNAIHAFIKIGLLCVGCPTEAFHTLADVAREYGIDPSWLLGSIEQALADDQTHFGA